MNRMTASKFVISAVIVFALTIVSGAGARFASASVAVRGFDRIIVEDNFLNTVASIAVDNEDCLVSAVANSGVEHGHRVTLEQLASSSINVICDNSEEAKIVIKFPDTSRLREENVKVVASGRIAEIARNDNRGIASIFPSIKKMFATTSMGIEVSRGGVSYNVKDGGMSDFDKKENGIIVDRVASSIIINLIANEVGMVGDEDGRPEVDEGMIEDFLVYIKLNGDIDVGSSDISKNEFTVVTNGASIDIDDVLLTPRGIIVGLKKSVLPDGKVFVTYSEKNGGIKGYGLGSLKRFRILLANITEPLSLDESWVPGSDDKINSGKICSPAFVRNLNNKSDEYEISKVQKFLKDENLYYGEPNGKWGLGVNLAIKSFDMSNKDFISEISEVDNEWDFPTRIVANFASCEKDDTPLLSMIRNTAVGVEPEEVTFGRFDLSYDGEETASRLGSFGEIFRGVADLIKTSFKHIKISSQ